MITIGEEGERIDSLLQQAHIATTKLGSDVTMDAIVKSAAHDASPGDVVILSPACASFGMFKNYSDRGDQFTDAVTRL